MIELDGPLDECMRPFVNLGHEKRNGAMLRQLAMLANSPGASNPVAAGKGARSMANLISLYRFVGNEAVPLGRLREIRANAVASLLPAGRLIPVVHDVTQLDYSRHNAKKDRRPIGDHQGMGYEYVPCLALDPDTGAILGVLHDTIVSEDGPDDADVMDYNYEPALAGLYEKERKRLLENHRHQMAVHVNGLAKEFPEHRFVHLGDREFDDLFILCTAGQTAGESHFVLRCTGNRAVQTPRQPWVPQDPRVKAQGGHALRGGWCHANLKDLVPAVPMAPYKDLPLDARGRVTEAAAAKRIARLHIGACRVLLFRPAKRNKKALKTPRPVEVSLVVVREPDPPPGVEPLCWTLFSTLPAQTLEQMAAIAWHYEIRWMVEVYFRVLKSGYQIERTRFDNAAKTAKLLVLLTLAATTLFELKQTLSLPFASRLNDEQYAGIKEAIKRMDDP